MSDFSFENLIEDITKFHKDQAILEEKNIIRFLDSHIESCEHHLKEYNFGIGEKNGMLKAFKIVKEYIGGV